jgi:hypothetical protein
MAELPPNECTGEEVVVARSLAQEVEVNPPLRVAREGIAAARVEEGAEPQLKVGIGCVHPMK